MQCKVIYGQDRRVAEWACGQYGVPIPDEYDAVGGEDADGNLMFGVVFKRYSPGDAEIMLASTGPRNALRGVIREVLSLPFDRYGCVRVTAEVPLTNSVCIKLAQGLGFQVEGLKRGTDVLVMGLLKGELRV